MFSAEINRCYFVGACVFCVIYFLDLLTIYLSTLIAISLAGVHYYVYKREENFRHRLAILGLIKHDKRERKHKSEPNSSGRAISANNSKSASPSCSRVSDSSFGYPRVVPGNKFQTGRRSLSRSEADEEEPSFSIPPLLGKNVFFDRSCQSTFTSERERKRRLNWLPAISRRQPVQQERYSVGSYPTVCLTKSALPLAKPFTSPEVIAPVKVKILPLASSPRTTNSFSRPAINGEAEKQDPCSTESVIQALKERRKRAAAAAYRDSLEAEASQHVLQLQSSKRARRESLCASGSPSPPPFVPVVTSVAGFGPPSFHPVGAAPRVAGRGLQEGGGIKRARLPSSGTPQRLPKRHRSNAISVSYCSSRKLLLEASQSQKRKVVARETSPQSKVTRRDDGNSLSETDTADGKIDDSSKDESTSPGQPCESTPLVARGDLRRLRRGAMPSDKSMQRKKLLFPEHVATLEEHESDRALDQKRLSMMLGSVQEAYRDAQGKTAIAADQPSQTSSVAAISQVAVPAASTYVQPEEMTKSVSVITTPLTSVLAVPSSPITLNKDSAGTAALLGATCIPTWSSSPAVTKALSTETSKANPLLGAPLSIVTTSTTETGSMLKLPAAVPVLAVSTEANVLLRGLSSTSSSTFAAPATLPLSAPSQSPSANTTLSTSLLTKTSQPGFATIFSTQTPISSGAPFQVNGPTIGVATTLTALSSSSAGQSTPSAPVFKFGSSTEASVTPASAVSTPVLSFASAPSKLPTAVPVQHSSTSGFSFDATSAPLATTAAAPFSFGSTASSNSSSLFTFGAASSQPPATGSTMGLVPTFTPASATTLPEFSKSTPFAFGAPPLKQESVPTFSFGKPQAPSASLPITFGTPTGTATSPALPSQVLTETASAQVQSATPLFPSASSLSSSTTATTTVGENVTQGGFSFGAPQAPSFSFATANGLSNGITPSIGNSTHQQPTGVFKFGGANSAPAASQVPAFNFAPSQCGPTSKTVFNMGGQVNNLFSIGTAAATHGERAMARPRSKRVVKK